MISNFDGDYAFLSNFFESDMLINNVHFPTMEHFFQASKAKSIKDLLTIASAPTPGAAKRLGRQIDLREDWEEVKEQCMKEGLLVKFSNPRLKAQLLATGDQILVEGNTWHDNCWGSCSCEKCGGHGNNLLGKLLMEIREELKNE